MHMAMLVFGGRAASREPMSCNANEPSLTRRRTAGTAKQAPTQAGGRANRGQPTSARTQPGTGTDLPAGKSTHTVVAPPSA
jgi:hypothetical protein